MVLTSISFVILTFPVMNIIEQETYNVLYLSQQCFVCLNLVLLLLYLMCKIDSLNKMSGH